MRVLILDDDDIRHRWFAKKFGGFDVTHVHTIQEFNETFAKEPAFDYVFLDHDLNENQYESIADVQVGAGDIGLPKRELTGKDAAMTIINHPEKSPGCVVVHSWNPGGAATMVGNLKATGFNVVRWEFNPKEDLKLK